MENAHVNLYTAIHKYLRQQFFTTLNAIGTVDEFDAESTAFALCSARALLNFCQTHLAHEDHFIHAAILRRSPATHLSASADHQEHQHRIAYLSEKISRLESAPAANAPQLWLELYRDMALFIGENLDHMHMEETLMFQLLCDLFSPGELEEIHAKLVASIPAAEMEALFAPLLSAQSYSDQLSVLTSSRQQLPPEAYRKLLHSLALLLPSERFLRLQTALSGVDAALAI